MIGQTIAGRFTVVRQLGEGGMGAVFEARDEASAPSGKRVAIKLITGAFARDPQLAARFEREAEAVSRVASENIVAVLAVGRDPALDAPFIAMEYLSGEDLQQLFARLGPVPADVALRIGVQACLGLERAHAAGIVHRDIKPANLFLASGDDGTVTVKLLDFGIAKLVAGDGPADVRKKPLTQTGMLLGSPLYMSPEQSRSRGKLDHRSDLWSLGIVLYQALAGRTPFDEVESLGDFIVAVCTTRVAPIRDRAPWVDAAVAAAIERALAIEPDDRYASAADMRAALAAFLPDGAALRASMLVRAPEAGPAPPPSSRPALAAEPGEEGPPETTTATPFEATTATPVVGGARGRAHTPSPTLVATIPGQPALSALTPSPGAAGGHLAPPRPPAQARARGSNAAGAKVAGALAIAAAASIAVVLVVRGATTSPRAEVEVADAAPVAPPAKPPPAAALKPLVGSWWSEGGVAYDAVLVGEALELRVVSPDQLPGQGYVPGEAQLVLRPAENEAGSFRVEARVRPTVPHGLVYNHARASKSCVVVTTHVGSRALSAAHAIDRLVIQTVRIEPAASAFVREGTRVVACAGLEEAHAIEGELVLGRTPPTSAPPRANVGVQTPPAHDAGAHDAGLHEPGRIDAGAHDAGAPTHHDAGAGSVGAPCESDAQCATENCYGRRCMPIGKGYGAPCSMDWQCASHHCTSSSCR